MLPALDRADWSLVVRETPEKSHKWYVRKWWVSRGYGWDQQCLLSIYNKQNFEKQCFLEHLKFDYKFDRLNSLKLFKFHYEVRLANSFWPLQTSTLNVRQNIYKTSFCNLLYIYTLTYSKIVNIKSLIYFFIVSILVVYIFQRLLFYLSQSFLRLNVILALSRQVQWSLRSKGDKIPCPEELRLEDVGRYPPILGWLQGVSFKLRTPYHCDILTWSLTL